MSCGNVKNNFVNDQQVGAMTGYRKDRLSLSEEKWKKVHSSTESDVHRGTMRNNKWNLSFTAHDSK